MPEPPDRARERKRAAREAGHRRDAVLQLNLAASTAGYAARQLADGLSPEQARDAALEAAGELAQTADALRRLVRLPVAERRARARQMRAFGVPTREIAAALGVTDRTARYYLAGRDYRSSGTR